MHVVDQAHLRFASDERACRVTRGCTGSGETLGRRDLDQTHPLCLDGADRPVVHAATRDLSRHRTDEDLAVLRHLLESCRDDHRLTGDEELGSLAIAGHDLAGIDADAEREAGSSILAVR